MALMKAMQIHRYGTPDVFVLEEIERPVPGTNEVLVRVHAVGINPSGEVVEVGAGVTQFAPGDEVYGLNRFPQLGKAYTEYVTAPVTDIVQKPGNLSHIEAAALPLVGLTAWKALFEYAKLQATA